MKKEPKLSKAILIKRDLVGRLILTLKKAYPNAHCELNYSTPLELLIATILSAQCTDVLVNQVTPTLFLKYKKAADYAEVPLSDLEKDIKRIGLFRSKAKNIQACCSVLRDRYHGEVPKTLEELIELGGVGRKTANVVLGNAFGISSGVVVDTHVARLSQRMGLTKQEDPKKIEQELMVLVPREEWTMFSHWMIWHGRRRCKARNPDCENCEWLKECPQKGV
ncbi:MAG: endonuclease III [Verrucomicrobiota bacterium]